MPSTQVEFASLAESIPAGWATIGSAEVPRLQAAIRAHHAGLNEDYVVGAPLDDIGDRLARVRHTELAVVIPEHYADPSFCWMGASNGVCQRHYHGGQAELDPNACEQFCSHTCFELTADLYARFDQLSFYRTFASMTVEAFVPMLGRILSVEHLAQRTAT